MGQTKTGDTQMSSDGSSAIHHNSVLISPDDTEAKSWSFYGVGVAARDTVIDVNPQYESAGPLLIMEEHQNESAGPLVIKGEHQNESAGPLVMVEKTQNESASLDSDGENNSDDEVMTVPPPEVIFERVVQKIDRDADPDSQKRMLGMDEIPSKRIKTEEVVGASTSTVVVKADGEMTPPSVGDMDITLLGVDEKVYLYYRRVTPEGDKGRTLHMYQRHNRIHMPFLFIPRIVDMLSLMHSDNMEDVEKLYGPDVFRTVASYRNLEVGALNLWKKEREENPTILPMTQRPFKPTFAEVRGFKTNYIHIRSKWNFLSFPKVQIPTVINTLCKFWRMTGQDIREMGHFIEERLKYFESYGNVE